MLGAGILRCFPPGACASEERQQARRDRDFDKADRLRNDLKDMGAPPITSLMAIASDDEDHESTQVSKPRFGTFWKPRFRTF